MLLESTAINPKDTTKPIKLLSDRLLDCLATVNRSTRILLNRFETS